jgi:hypothetical protein
VGYQSVIFKNSPDFSGRPRDVSWRMAVCDNVHENAGIAAKSVVD